MNTMNKLYLITFDFYTTIENKKIKIKCHYRQWAENEYQAAFMLGQYSNNALFKGYIFDVIMTDEELKEFMISHDCYSNDIIWFDLKIIRIKEITNEVY